MRFTRQTNYAFRALIYCATNQNDLSKVATIAKAHGISETFLFKIVQPLAEAGLLQTVRGRNGGVRLGRSATDISLWDVVQITEDGFALAECFEEGASTCPLIDHCLLTKALKEAMAAFTDVLKRHTIADISANRGELARLLAIEPGVEPLKLAAG